MRLLKDESARRAKARMMARRPLPVNGRAHVVTVNTSVPRMPHKQSGPEPPVLDQGTAGRERQLCTMLSAVNIASAIQIST